MSEKEFQAKITALCTILGLKWYHNPDSRRSNAGFPDLVILGPHGLVFIEVKTERGRISREQWEWHDQLRFLGHHAYIVRPSMWPAIEKVLMTLAGRNLVGQEV